MFPGLVNLKLLFTVFSKQSQRKLLLLSLIQALLGTMDVLAIAIVGTLAAITVSEFSNSDERENSIGLINKLGIESYSSATQLLILGCLASSILILRSILSIQISRRTIHFLSNLSAEISASLAARFFALPFSEIEKKESQEVTFSINRGVESLVLRVLGGYVAIFADFSILFLLFTGLAFLDPAIAVSSLVFFGGMGIALHFATGNKARTFGLSLSNAEIESNKLILDTLLSFREMKVLNRIEHRVEKISKSRKDLAFALGEMAFLPSLTKYLFESGIVIGAILVTTVQYLTNDAIGAASALSVFVIASARIAPAIMRIQQTISQVRSNTGVANTTLELLQLLHDRSGHIFQEKYSLGNESKFSSNVSIRSVEFSYDPSARNAISDFSLEITPGTTIAIVGGTGSGKSTLLDLILGIRNPSEGVIEISGVEPSTATLVWPGCIAYMPQESRVFQGTIRENIGRGFDKEEVSEEMVRVALQKACFTIPSVEEDKILDFRVEENGSNLSGGQRQRLAIARSLYLNPKLLLLDEITSSLDAETEAKIMEELLDGKDSDVTVIIVAHRLSAIRGVDRIAFLSDGRLVDYGSFNDIYNRNLAFRSMAQTMGLNESTRFQ